MKIQTLTADPQKVRLAMARSEKTIVEIMKETGLSRETIYRITVGRQVKPATLGKMARALNVDPADLLAND